MILVAGGTGVLGRAIVGRLLDEGRAVRVLTRTAARASEFTARGAEIAVGDLRDAPSLQRACTGARHVITTANAFMGRGADSIAAVDETGNRNLIDAAREAAVRQFVFTSALITKAHRTVDYFAAKLRTEAYLRQSGLTFTILRPTAFMEIWAELIGEPLVRTGVTRIFGSGRNPINFVAVADVAAVAAMTLDRPDAQNAVVEIGGPENLTPLQVAETFERVTGRSGQKKHQPAWVLHLLAGLVRPFNPVFARQVKLGALATLPQPFDPSRMLEQYPITLTRLEEWVRARYR